MSRTETKAGTCLECGRPLPGERPAPNPHRLYHDSACRDLHRRNLASFTERNPELPGWGYSPIGHLCMGERLGVVRASDDRLAIRFEKGPAKKKVREHHETGTLPITYYLADGAGAEDAATFLQKSYPNGGGPLMPPAAPTKSAIYMRVSKDDGSQESDKEAYAAYTLMRWGIF